MVSTRTSIPDLTDTIVAIATPPGAGLRAIVRLSGIRSAAIAAAVFPSLPSPLAKSRRLYSGDLLLPGVDHALPADVYFYPGPHSYTGQDAIEIHTLSSPPFVEVLATYCLNAGARAAGPGEFTMRAFLAGKLDLTRAEAVLGVIEAGSRDELTQALTQLAGGIALPLQALREDLLNLLADVEAALDFADEDIQFTRQEDLLQRLTKGLALVTLVRRQLQQRSLSRRLFRVLLIGPPNAGKSSLFNALAGGPHALVSAEPGTTRDYLEQTLDLGGTQVLLVDTAGLRQAKDALETAAQGMSVREADNADLLLLCQEQGVPRDTRALGVAASSFDRLLPIATKSDLGSPPGVLRVSTVTGEGLSELREVLCQRASRWSGSALAPSLSRCSHHVDACLEHLRHAHRLVLEEAMPELLALDLRLALEELGAMVGAVYTDDLLDRVFSRFCIGK